MPIMCASVSFSIRTQKANNVSGAPYTPSSQWGSLSAEFARACEPIHTYQPTSGLVRKGLGRISYARCADGFLVFEVKNWYICIS